MFAMLLASWLKRLLERRRSAAKAKKPQPSPFAQLGLTRLEERVVLTVTAAIDLAAIDQLNVTVDSSGAFDAATVSTDGMFITVSDSSGLPVTTPFAAALVASINVMGASGGSESVIAVS